MSISFGLRAYIPDTDPEYQRHKSVVIVCNAAGVSLPLETSRYFGDTCCSSLDILLSKLEIELEGGLHYKDREDGMGVTLNIADLPQGVSRLEFYVE